MTEGATCPIPFALGETVWWARWQMTERPVECPECAGTCALTLVKGNGETVSLDCNYCKLGFDPPRGYVMAREYDSGVRPFVCRRIASMYSDKLDDINYTDSEPGATCYSTVAASFLFRDKAAAEAKSAELAAAEAKRVEDCQIASLASKRRSLAFSSHYWKREVMDLERKLVLARARLAVCKKPKVAKVDHQPETAGRVE